MNFPSETYAAIADVSVAFTPPPASPLSDSDLVDAQRILGEIRRRVDAAASAIAAEIDHRSRRELGYDGLAQRLGARTPQLLVQQLAGGSAREAQTMVRVGALMSRSSDPDQPAWLAGVGDAVSAGSLSIEAADVIRAGLGLPDDSVPVASLAGTARTLIAEAASLTLERLAARARDLRTELDLEHVLDRENALRDRRYLRVTAQADGMTRLNALLDPESAATVVGAYDSITSPRRGGPRFVDRDSASRSDALLDDARSTEQLALDAFVELIRIASATADDKVLGANRPAVRVLVTEPELRNRRGVGSIDGQTEPLSIASVERQICSVGIIPVMFDRRGQSVDVGRTQRLYTSQQRIALAARDGGCRFPGCARPVSWTEAHHIHEWHRGGRTDLADGILLCRYHHMLAHNNGWRVTRHQADYFVVPPPSIDPAQHPIPAPSRSAPLRRLLAAASA